MPFVFVIALFLIQGFSSAAHADIARFAQVAPGIFRGAQPQEQADYDRLKALGVKTILNLRLFPWDVTDEEELARNMAFNFHHVPMNASPVSPSVDTVNQALEVLMNPSLQPVFIHCTHGRDRTGLVIALYRIYHDRWTPAAAHAEWESFGYGAGFLVSGLEHYFREHDNPSKRWNDAFRGSLSSPVDPWLLSSLR